MLSLGGGVSSHDELGSITKNGYRERNYSLYTDENKSCQLQREYRRWCITLKHKLNSADAFARVWLTRRTAGVPSKVASDWSKNEGDIFDCEY